MITKSAHFHLGLIPKTDGTYAIPSRNIVSEYPNHVGDVPRSPLWSFWKSVAMINKEIIPPSSGIGDVDTTHDELRVSKRRRSGDQSDQITTNQERPPLILMSNFNNVATATPGDTLSAEKGGGARTSVPVPLAPASNSRK